MSDLHAPARTGNRTPSAPASGGPAYPGLQLVGGSVGRVKIDGGAPLRQGAAPDIGYSPM